MHLHLERRGEDLQPELGKILEPLSIHRHVIDDIASRFCSLSLIREPESLAVDGSCEATFDTHARYECQLEVLVLP